MYTEHALQIPLDKHINFNKVYDIQDLYDLLHGIVVDPVHIEELLHVRCGTPDMITREMHRVLFKDGCGWYDHAKGLVLFCVEYTDSGLEWVLEPLLGALE